MRVICTVTVTVQVLINYTMFILYWKYIKNNNSELFFDYCTGLLLSMSVHAIMCKRCSFRESSRLMRLIKGDCLIETIKQTASFFKIDHKNLRSWFGIESELRSHTGQKLTYSISVSNLSTTKSITRDWIAFISIFYLCCLLAVPARHAALNSF